jgi:glycosyltransferase involved in cell wall biosynthesis
VGSVTFVREAFIGSIWQSVELTSTSLPASIPVIAFDRGANRESVPPGAGVLLAPDLPPAQAIADAVLALARGEPLGQISRWLSAPLDRWTDDHVACRAGKRAPAGELH